MRSCEYSDVRNSKNDENNRKKGIMFKEHCHFQK